MQILQTKFTSEYSVEHPIAQAAMAFVGTVPDLAIAVCQTGGVGSIAVGPLPGETIRKLIRDVRSVTDKPLNVNFITFLSNKQQIDVCIEEEVPIVSFHWGHPPPEYIRRLHAAGIKVWEQVGSAEAAREAVDLGIDLIIAQGSEAGGHNLGSLPTFVLVPTIVEAVSPVPVLAAGGISNGRQMAAALMLGAAGVWVGTRFVASEEAFAHPRYKEQLIKANGSKTRLSSVYGPNMPDFNPMRVLDVGLAQEFAGREDTAPKDLERQPVIGKMNLVGEEVPLHRFSSFVPTPVTTGNIDEMPFLAGQGVGLVEEILPAKRIMENMLDEAVSAIRSISVQ